MKIEFRNKQNGPNERNINDVKQWLVDFLNNNGFIDAESALYVKGGQIVFCPRCANSNMTKAIGLMLLLFSADNKEMFVAFQDEMYIDRSSKGSWHIGYEYLESIGMDVKIEF